MKVQNYFAELLVIPCSIVDRSSVTKTYSFQVCKMEMTPMHRILKLEEVRKAMLRSAETQLGPIHPATRLDLNEFYNSCTGCLAATKQLQVNLESGLKPAIPYCNNN